MANLLQAQQYIDEGNHTAAKEVLESALRDEPRNRAAMKMLHSLERSTAPIIAVSESSPVQPAPSFQPSVESDFPAPILDSASQIIKSMNDAAIGGLIVAGIIAVGGLVWGLWSLTAWVQTLDSQALFDTAFDLVNSLIPVYYIPIGLGLAFSIIGAIVQMFHSMKL